MHSDLESIVASDEEARSRVERAEERRGQELASAQQARDAEVEARRAEARAALDRELRAIRAEGDARVAELERRQAESLAALAATGTRRFDEAVALYLRIVCEASS